MKKVLSIFLALIMIMSTMACLATTVSASYDSMSTARNVTMGTTYTGSISSSDTTEFYKFTISSSSLVKIVFSAPIGRAFFNLYDANGNKMTDESPRCSDSGVLYYERSYHLINGTYYFKINDYWGESYGNYTLKFTSVSSGESFSEDTGNTFDSANSISFNKTYKGQIAENDSVDFYKFSIPSSSSVSLSINALSSRIFVELYDSKGTEIREASPRANDSGMIVFKECYELTKGIYYIKISDYYDNGHGNYSFMLSYSASGETFVEDDDGINNTMATANHISFSKNYKGHLGFNDTVDFYQFTLNSDSKVSFNLSSNLSRLSIDFYKDDGGDISSDSPRKNNSGQIVFNKIHSLSKGVYYVKICTYYNESYGNYSFNLSKYVETPAVSSTNALNGVQISWNEIPGASKYTVFRRQGGSSTWVNVGTTTGTTLLDKNVKSGIYYVYSVRAFSSDGSYSAYESGKTSTRKYMATPKLTTIYNHQNGLAIKWNAVAGVTNGYRVYRRGAGSTSWTYLGTTKNLYFIDSQVKNKSGEYFRYTVIADGGYHSKFDTTGLYLRRLANPTLNSAVSSKSGITVKWGKVAGSSGYYVYRKTANSTWTRVGTVGGTNNTTFLDKTAKKGTTYTYTVKAVYGATTSAYYSGISCYDKY